MKSHEVAAQLCKTGAFLLGRPEVELPGFDSIHIWYFWTKEQFLEAVKAFGAGKKDFDGSYLNFYPTNTCLVLRINRDAVCLKVQEEKWECAPLLSKAEIDAFEAELK